MDFFVNLPDVVKVWGQGPTKSSVRLKQGFDIDLRVIEKKSWGAAWQYFTGSKEHNIAIRRLAIKHGFKLNEYGLFKGKKQIAGKNEKQIYKKIGLCWIPPEIRQNNGEVEKALQNKLPRLIDYGDIKGDLHLHTNWSDGRATLKQIVKACYKMNYNYIAITDHAGYKSKFQNGLDAKRLAEQGKEIDQLQKEYSSMKILKGAEFNITKQGEIDAPDKVLKKLDWVNAGVHQGFKMSKKQMTKRLIKVLQNPYLKVLVHPTGRLLNARPGYDADWEKVFKTAVQNNVCLEINSQPDRLDLFDELIKLAINCQTKLVINTDSHDIDSLPNINLGIAQARRGWCEKSNVLNTQNLI